MEKDCFVLSLSEYTMLQKEEDDDPHDKSISDNGLHDPGKVVKKISRHESDHGCNEDRHAYNHSIIKVESP